MTPLEDWMHDANRPLRTDILASARDPTIQTNYSSVQVLDAYPLFYAVCDEWYESVDALSFSVVPGDHPKSFSGRLTITRPDKAKLQFVASQTYPDARQAMLKMAYSAVKQGALDFILRGPPIWLSNKKPIHPLPSVPPRQVNANTTSPRVHIPMVPLGPALQKAKADIAGASFDTLFGRVNQATQRIFEECGVPLQNALDWEVQKIGEKGWAALFTVRTPFGGARDYGGNVPPCRTYGSPKEAKLAVLELALKDKVLDFISSAGRRDPPPRSPVAPLQTLAHSIREATASSSIAAPPTTSTPSASPPLCAPDHLVNKKGAAGTLSPKEKLRTLVPAATPIRAPALHGRGTKRVRFSAFTNSSTGEIRPLQAPLLERMDDDPSPQFNPATRNAHVPAIKKQKLDHGVGATLANNAKEKEPEGNAGQSYHQKLSEFCFKTGRPQVTFTLRGPLEDSASVNDALYVVSATFDGMAYQIKQHHPALPAAMEKLSKYMLSSAQTGTTPTSK